MKTALLLLFALSIYARASTDIRDSVTIHDGSCTIVDGTNTLVISGSDIYINGASAFISSGGHVIGEGAFADINTNLAFGSLASGDGVHLTIDGYLFYYTSVGSAGEHVKWIFNTDGTAIFNGGQLTGITFSQLGSTPTTLTGYGITDAAKTIIRVSGTLVSGTASISNDNISGLNVWAQDNASSITNVGALTVSVSGTTATIKSSVGVLDTSPFSLFIAP